MNRQHLVTAALCAGLALSLGACGAEDGGPKRSAPDAAPPAADNAAEDTGSSVDAAKDALRDAAGNALESAAKDALGSAAKVSHPARDAVLAALPSKIGAYTQKDMKVKSNVPNFEEFSATYEGGGKELKVVVNDFVDLGGSAFRPHAWRKEIEASGLRIGGYPAFTETKEDKHTTMILLSDRIRLDVKSRVETAAAVEALAKGIDLTALAALAEALPD